MADRIKGLRQKNSQGVFDALVPFGTDGIFVDMVSGLDNEEELKIGGNHTSTIVENSDGSTTITELFKNLNNVITYTIVTNIITAQNGSTTITSVLKERDTETVLRSKTITIPADASSITIGEVLD